MTQKKPILHLGHLKTGSTFLQRQVFSNTDYFYPLGRYGDGGERSADDAMHQLLWESLFVDEYTYDQQKSSLMASIKKHQSLSQAASNPMVLSNEAITFFGGAKTDLKQRLQRLKSLFGDCKAVFVFREQTDFLNSFYSSLVCDSGLSLGFDDFVYQNLQNPLSELYCFPSLDYVYLYEVIHSVFDDVILLPFELLQQNSAEFYRQLADFMEVPVTIFEGKPKENAARSADKIAYARAFNSYYETGISASRNFSIYPFLSSIYQNCLKDLEKTGELTNYQLRLMSQAESSRHKQIMTLNDFGLLKKVCKLLEIQPIYETYPTDRQLEIIRGFC